MVQATFGIRARSQREQKGLSLRAAAKLLGIGHARLSEIEKGIAYRSGAPTGPSRDLVERMAKVYDAPRDTLLELAGFRASRPALSPTEAELVDLFRGLPGPSQALLLEMVRAARNHFQDQ